MNHLLAYSNPYSGDTLLTFFGTFFFRLFAFFSGTLSWRDLATDEVQVIALVGIAVSCALVGSFLVLRKMTMLANSLSHTILIGIVVACFLTISGDSTHEQLGALSTSAMLLVAVFMGVITSWLTEGLVRYAGVQEDASIGIVFSSLFALGVILLTLYFRNSHIGTEIVMGNVDALHLDDCGLIYFVLAVNLLLFILCYKGYVITTFDSSLAKSVGFSPDLFRFLLMMQASVTIVSAFRAVGVVMVLTLLTGPPLAARFLTYRLLPLLASACVIGAVASFFGVAFSRHLLSVSHVAISTAGVVVLVVVGVFLLALLVSLLPRIATKSSS